MTKPKNLVLFVGIGLAVIVLISVAVGIPLYSRYSSKKEEIQEKEKIQKRIDFFSSTLSKIESSSQLEMKDLDELATIYKEISASCRKVSNFSACDSFISQNGLVDKLTSLRAKARPLVQDLYAHSRLRPEFNKLLGLGLADAQIIFDMNTEAQRQEKDRADSLATDKIKMEIEISSKTEELRLQNEKITNLESDLKRLKKACESTINEIDKDKVKIKKDQLKDLNISEKLNYQNLLNENRKSLEAADSVPLRLLNPIEDLETDENLRLAISTFLLKKTTDSLLNAYKICMDVHKNRIQVCDALFELPRDWKAAIADPAKCIILHDKYDSLKMTALRPVYLEMLVSVIQSNFFKSFDEIDGRLDIDVYNHFQRPLTDQLSKYIKEYSKSPPRHYDLKSDLLKEFKPTGSKVIEYWGNFVKQNCDFAITFEHATDFDRYLGILKDLIERDFLLFKEMVYKLISYVSSRGPSKISLAEPSKIMYQSILDDQKQFFTSALIEMKDLISEPSFAHLKCFATPPNFSDLCKEIRKSADAGKVFEKLSQVLKKLLLIKLYKAIKRVSSSYLAPIGPLTSGPLLEVCQQIDPSLIYYMSFISEMFKCHSNNEDLKNEFFKLFNIGFDPKTTGESDAAHTNSIRNRINREANKSAISTLLRTESGFFFHYNSIFKCQILDTMIGDLTKTTDWDENKRQLVNVYQKYQGVAQKLYNLA